MYKGFGKQKQRKVVPHLVVETIISDGKPTQVLVSSSSSYSNCPLCGDRFKVIGKPCHWCNDGMEWDDMELMD